MHNTYWLRGRKILKSLLRKVRQKPTKLGDCSDDLKELRETWDDLGKADPLWAILTDPSKRGGKWELEEFFESGRAEMEGLLEWVEYHHVRLQKSRALDFGCGVGRLTQALCAYFDQCDGVDIAPSMIELANAHNSYGDKCRYHLIRADNLKLFPNDSFDFICSMIVLQHIRPAHTSNYIREFMRILAPGGILLFQLPSHRREVRVTEPLPDTAFNASITVHETLPINLAPGTIKTIPTTIRNLSAFTWPVSKDSGDLHAIRPGTRCFDDQGDLVHENERGSFPDDIRPMDEVNVELRIISPSIPGRYRVVFDVVQEYVAWFQDKGSSPAVVTLDVEGESPRSGQQPCNQPAATRIEMHAVHKDEVLALVQSEKGEVLATKEDLTRLPDFVDCIYLVKKLVL